MDQNSPKKSIKQFFKDKIDSLYYGEYTPKFKVGDIIFNKKYKVVSKVIKIEDTSKLHGYLDFDEKVKKDIHSQYVIYTLIDIGNPSIKNQANVGRAEKYKSAGKIDMFYEKIDERAARVLFGVTK